MHTSRRLTTILSCALAAATLTFLPASPAAASPPDTGPGSLDTNFGSAGMAQLGSAASAADSVVVQRDGKIVVAAIGARSAVTVYRLNTDGSWDYGWGTNGRPYQWLNAINVGEDPKLGIAEDASGNVYVASALPTVGGGGPQAAVLRLTSAGLLDTTWGTGGVFQHSFGGGANDHATSVAVGPDGRVFVSVWSADVPPGSGDFAVMALQPAHGLLDESFGTGGIATTDFDQSIDTARDLTVLPSGKVLVAGYVRNGTQDNTGLWQLNANGTPDRTFGTEGKVETDIGKTHNDGARSVAVGDDGTIYVSGLTEASGTLGYVAAYAADGSLLRTFNQGATTATGGSLTTDFGATSSTNAGLTVDPDGHAVVVGGTGGANAAPGVARLVNGRYAFDTTFNTTGQETLDCPSGVTGGASGVAVQTDGKIVVVGSCSGAVTVWRLNGGDSVPLPATPTASAGLTASSIDVNQSGRSATVAPGGSVSLTLTYSLPPQTDGAIDEVVTGFVNRGPEQCVDLGVPTRGAGDTIHQSFPAPTIPGRYFLALSFVQWYGCTGGSADAQSWDLGGYQWGGEPVPAAYLAEVIVSSATVPGASGLQIDAGGGTIAAGHHATPVDSIPLDGLTGTLDDLQSAPLRGSPLRGSPLRGSPLLSSPDAAPLRGSPLRGSPLRGSPLRGSPLRGSPIPLSEVPLSLPNTWAAVLAGTTYASQPLQNVTLQQVLADPAAALTNVSLADIDLTHTPLRNVSLVAFLLGNTPASAFRRTLPTGADGSQSLIGLELAGVDLSSFYAPGVQLNHVTLVDAPITTVRLGDMWLSQTPFGAVPLSALPSGWASCRGTCTSQSAPTLADAQAGDPDAGIADIATVGALLALSAAPDVTIGQLMPGLIPRDQLPYQHMSTDAIAAASPLPESGVPYTATFTVTCGGGGPLSVSFALPAGFRYVPKTAKLSVGGNDVSPVTASGNVTMTATVPACTGAQPAVAQVQAEPGTALGGTSDTATVSYGGDHLTATDQAAATVTDNPDTTAVGTAPTVFLGRIVAAGEQDSYTLSSPPAGSTLTVSLGNVPAGQDYDLSVFGPTTQALRSSPLRGSPLRGSPLRGSPVTDTTLAPSSDGSEAPAEPQTDVPLDLTGSGVWGVSDNRGNSDESLSTVVADGTSGPVTIRVSGYNGSTSALPYSLLVSVTPVAGAPACATQSVTGTAGAAPTSIPVTTQTIILTDQARLSGLYGDAAATTVMAKLRALAARSDVKGVVLPVEADSTVAGKYTAWNNDPCSPAAANAVTAAINAYVDKVRADNNLTDLRSIVIAGGDQVVPMARVRDRVALDNEQTYAGDEVYGGKDNALSAALRGGYFLTDDPYGDFDPIPWLDGQAYVPDVALGRLVETPNDITTAVDAYVAANGVRSPNTAYTAGYDFNSDGAQQVADTLAARVPVGAASTNISSTWTKADSIAGLTAAAHGFLSVNAHYDAYRSLPASEFTGGTQSELLGTTDLPADLSGSIVFTIGCHAGLSVADTFVTTPTPRTLDWPQAVASRGGVSAANTGYGYGDSAAVAYSERLMADFAKNLDGKVSVGQALMFAKQSYVHLPLGAVDAKVMSEATFYGLPMYRIGTAGTTAPSVVPLPLPTGGPTSAAPQTASFTGSRTLVAQTTGIGTYYAVQTGTATPEPPLALPGRPLEPQTAITLGSAPAGTFAHGIRVTALSTSVTSTSGAFDPVYSAAVPDSSALTPEPATTNAFFPATLAGLVSRATPAGIKDVAVLNPGQFRSAGSGGKGFQQLASSIGYDVLYSGNGDVTPPSISTADGSVSAGTAQFTVTIPDSDVNDVRVLYLAQSSTAPQTWTPVDLTQSSDGHTWTGTHSQGTATIEQFLVQATDKAGNVASSTKKGQEFQAEAAPVGAAPAITLNGAATAGVYSDPQTVTITGSGTVSYTLDAGTTSKPYSGPFVVSGGGQHTVTATDGNGSTTFAFTIAVSSPSVSISSPVDGGTYPAGVPIPVTVTCTGDGVSCPAPATADNTPGTHTLTVTAKDSHGNTATASATYTVQYRFVGFLGPVNDPAGTTMSVFKKGSVVPLGFQLRDGNGALVPDATAAAMAKSCQVTLSFAKATTVTAAPVNEAFYNYTPDTSKCFRYTSTLHGFFYSVGAAALGNPANGTIYTLTATVTVPGGTAVRHSVAVAFR